MKGTVKWYNEEKGFGFIFTENNEDIFVHRSGIENRNALPVEGQTVEFEVQQGDKGPIAVNVKNIDE